MMLREIQECLKFFCHVLLFFIVILFWKIWKAYIVNQ